MISDEQIKALALARGFKLTNETGDDLKPYVYAFARDIAKLEIQAFCERCALTDDNILAVRDMAINGDEPIHEKIIWFGRMIATLAQQVKPLNWRQDGSYWRAICDYGFYELRPVGFFFRVYLNESSNHNILAREVAGLEESMCTAQADFAARVLANLKYGGKDD